MRGVRLAVVIALTMSLMPLARADAAGPPRFVHADVYRAVLPLSNGGRAAITFERFVGSSYTNPGSQWQALPTFQGCLHVETRKPRYISELFHGCGRLRVKDYDFDPGMNTMRLHFTVPDVWRGSPRATVKLVVRGRGPVRDRGLDVDADDYYDGYIVSSYKSRRAVARGTIDVPYFGSRRVRQHSGRGAILESLTQVPTNQQGNSR